MVPLDTRRPCYSCDRRDLRLDPCDFCMARVCSECWVLHAEYDHKDKQRNKKRDSEEHP